MSEMLVIVGVALLVFGPTELPQIAKKIARGVRDIRRASDDFRRSIDLDGDDDHVRPLRGPLEAPPSITGSALTGNASENVSSEAVNHQGPPSIVPVAAIAVGSPDSDDSAMVDDDAGHRVADAGGANRERNGG
jgi:Sec-independent protein translocase protein TatA